MNRRQTPPNLFAIPFGLAGLASVWRLMSASYGAPVAISDVLFAMAAAVWLSLAAPGLEKLIRAPRAIRAELRDPGDERTRSHLRRPVTARTRAHPPACRCRAARVHDLSWGRQHRANRRLRAATRSGIPLPDHVVALGDEVSGGAEAEVGERFTEPQSELADTVSRVDPFQVPSWASSAEGGSRRLRDQCVAPTRRSPGSRWPSGTRSTTAAGRGRSRRCG